MSSNIRAAAISATQMVVGLSSIVKFTPPQYMTSGIAAIRSGGGTLEIVPTPSALSGSDASGWGDGYHLGASERMPLEGPTAFYMAATGATMTAEILMRFTSGVTLL